MLDFLVIGLPRSATTWASNWLTWGSNFCWNDPLYQSHYMDWGSLRKDCVESGAYTRVGASCTGIWRWPGYVQGLTCPKLILQRSPEVINRELMRLGLPALELQDLETFSLLDGLRVNYEDLFDTGKARQIWEYLIGDGFCPIRHEQLVLTNVQTNFQVLKADPDVTRRLYEELSHF